jgi:hypothetical protein
MASQSLEIRDQMTSDKIKNLKIHGGNLEIPDLFALATGPIHARRTDYVQGPSHITF